MLAPLLSKNVVTEADIKIMKEKQQEAFPRVPTFSVEEEDESAYFQGNESNWLSSRVIDAGVAWGNIQNIQNLHSRGQLPITQQEMIAM